MDLLRVLLIIVTLMILAGVVLALIILWES